MRATWSLALFGQGALHLSNPQPPDASSKLVVNKLALRLDVLHAVHNRATRFVHHRLRLLEMQGWMFGASDGPSPARTCGASPSMLESHSVCHSRLHLPDAHYLPKSLRDTIQAERGAWMASESRLARSAAPGGELGNYPSRHQGCAGGKLGQDASRKAMHVAWTQVKLPQQVLFSEKNPAEGNFGIVASKAPYSAFLSGANPRRTAAPSQEVWLQYLPLVKACWRSLP